jgi:general L-amino acid transport system permease protein
MADQHAVAFVRTETIPQKAPPPGETGVVKWMKENLFSTWLNSALTIVAFYIILRFLMGVFPWFFNGVWDAASIKECRDIMNAAGTSGSACFAVLVDRWDHLMFGFKYPQTEYWRPVLAFVLLVACAMPALFAMYVPRKWLIATALYPFLAFWLIWGGTLWVPIVVLAILFATAMVFRLVEGMDLSTRKILSGVVGVITGAGLAYLLLLGAQELWFIAGNLVGGGFVAGVAGYLFYAASLFTFVCFIPMGIFVGYAIYTSYEDGGLVTIVSTLMALYVMMSFLLAPIAGVLSSIVGLELLAVPSRDMGGYMLCMILGTVCVSLSIPLGIVLALGRQSDMPLIKGVCVIFIEFIRGVPLITLLFVAGDPPDHSAAGFEDFHSGDRQRGGGSVQRHNTGIGDFNVRHCGHDPWPDPAVDGLDLDLLGSLSVRGDCVLCRVLLDFAVFTVVGASARNWSPLKR